MAVTNFEDWRKCRNDSFANESEKQVPEDILKCSSLEPFCKWLTLYVAETRKKDGNEYPSALLFFCSMVLSLADVFWVSFRLFVTLMYTFWCFLFTVLLHFDVLLLLLEILHSLLELLHFPLEILHRGFRGGCSRFIAHE